MIRTTLTAGTELCMALIRLQRFCNCISQREGFLSQGLADDALAVMGRHVCLCREALARGIKGKFADAMQTERRVTTSLGAEGN